MALATVDRSDFEFAFEYRPEAVPVFAGAPGGAVTWSYPPSSTAVWQFRDARSLQPHKAGISGGGLEAGEPARDAMRCGRLNPIG